MTKLSNLRPALGTMPTRLGTVGPADERERSALRSKTEPSFKWYNSARWKKLRMSVLVRDRFTCQRCKLVEPDTSKLVADHIIPHRNDPVKFWDGKLQCLCRNCHSGAKQAEEKAIPTIKGCWY
ncbi:MULTISPECIES: HNH endonuclease [unclassified Mesorhizobium]|uniref:HNH endonuclease n=1 Tax=unclassified Mesorhizobium TaxID=325217 RepID=UPI000FCB9108|nr:MULTISPECIES: HNH endonuclease [unclassified Mesorhizobium]RUU65017.1 HNH endonuclease [Mesorhizobium sp. M7A.T.Ca.TU.009.01.1.1]RUU78719.1 HNH endonuclease [Mesorhizobium sp. M7A.T.Ca.TU.009.01.1.2]RUT88129.1 HNH endonuclease [Mesorhizobium sp. M7A.T.Ca.US.000.02.1.1]RUT91864.1 HNH endonuclease [Mesorhizobium sp. M7A.T.Ca.US.000.02.2.1]RUT99733.1 HNH endonuclease [Mesorhizobium sp. M7A.T.Ca.TU.009.02.1.1]